MKKIFILIILVFYCSLSNIIVNPNWKQYKEIPKRIAALQIKDEVIDTISLRSL